MQFPVTIASIFVLLSVATAAPAEEKRQGKSSILIRIFLFDLS
jgi:hypothetical protein